jgi:glycerophosphoryl diester phosphodiesterase
MKYIAHRGVPTLKLENTLGSFQEAIARGAQYVECDVWCAADGELVVIHDATLERTHQGTGRVSAHSALLLMDAGIPTLQQVMEATGDATVVVELKGKGTADALSMLLEKPVHEGGVARERIIVSSFMKTELVRMKRLQPTVRTAVLIYGAPTEDEIDLYNSWGVEALHINDDGDDISESLVRQIHDRSLEVWAYTVNTKERAAILESLGVDGVFTDVIHLL